MGRQSFKCSSSGRIRGLELLLAYYLKKNLYNLLSRFNVNMAIAHWIYIYFLIPIVGFLCNSIRGYCNYLIQTK